MLRILSCIDRKRFVADRVIALRPITWAEIRNHHDEMTMNLPAEIMDEITNRFLAWKERVA